MAPTARKSVKRKRTVKRRSSRRNLRSSKEMPASSKDPGGVLKPGPSSSSKPVASKEKKTISWRRPLRTVTAPITKLEGKPKKSEEGSGRQKKRRKPRKFLYSLFSSTATVRARPSLTLTVQLKYALETVPAKLKDLHRGTISCHLKRIHELEKVEDKLLHRLGLVSNLKLGQDADDDLIEGKYQVISELEKTLLQVQTLHRTKWLELTQVRVDLCNKWRRNVCCPACAKRF